MRKSRERISMDVIQVAQRAVDLDRATAFYTDLLGSGPIGTFDPPGLVFFQAGSVRLLLERGAPSALIYLRVEDVRAFAEDWRGRGGTIESEPHLIFSHQDDKLGPAGTDEWMTFIRDSEDNMVGLVSHHPVRPS